MKLLTSSRLNIPKVFFISDRKEIKDIPIGIPFIYGDVSTEQHIIRLLEYEVLYQQAIKTGYPFNFKKILMDNGYADVRDFGYEHPLYMEFSSEKYLGVEDEVLETTKLKDLKGQSKAFIQYVKDSSCYVNIEKLKELHVFPLWLDKIEEAISTNIHNFATYNNNMYNKKLEGMYGGIELSPPNRNLIVIDISGSIPKAVSSTTLTLAKNLSETFYADLLITGSKSTLYHYEELYKLDVETIYEENGMNNDQTYFKNLVSSEEKNYKTAIVFGDNHSPCHSWRNEYNINTHSISREDGKKLCKWNINKIISFHTSSSTQLAGYADWFDAKEIENIKDWVIYLNKI